jgi:hypothetical protein
VKPLGSRTLVHITASQALFPRRSFLLPPTLLLPRRLGLICEITACVVGDLQSGKVSRVQGGCVLRGAVRERIGATASGSVQARCVHALTPSALDHRMIETPGSVGG